MRNQAVGGDHTELHSTEHKGDRHEFTTNRLPRHERRIGPAGLNDWTALKVEVEALRAPHCL